MTIPAGILLPESVLYSDWFGVFAAFVAINTVIYVLLSLSKLFPVIRFGRKRKGYELRAETRSIYPEGFEPGRADVVSAAERSAADRSVADRSAADRSVAERRAAPRHG